MEILIALAPWVIIFGVFWFLFIRPQKNRQKEREEMLSNLSEGDKVITIGGIRGEIVKLKEEALTLKVADEVEIEVNRGSIGSQQD